MLMLLFQLGNSQYAIPASEVVEVVPYIRLEPIARTPEYVSGLFNHRGTHVPVIDLCQMVSDSPCNNCFTTRIILVEFPLISGGKRTLGLIAERVTETVVIDKNRFSSTGLKMNEADLIQQMTVGELLPEEIQFQLFPTEAV